MACYHPHDVCFKRLLCRRPDTASLPHLLLLTIRYWEQALKLEKFIERLLRGPVSWLALIRVLAWGLIVTVVIGQILPEPVYRNSKALFDRPDSVSMLLDNDQLEHKSVKFEGEKKLRLAWIGGSSVTNMFAKPGDRFLPIKTADRLAEIRNVEVNGYYYTQQAQRFIDVYTLLLDALQRNPDVIVITLNPFWIYSNHAIFRSLTVIENRSDLWFSTADWPLWLAVTSPSSHFLTHVGGSVPLFMPPRKFRRGVTTGQNWLFGKPSSQANAEITGENFYNFDGPLAFWLNQTTTRFDGPRPNQEHDPMWGRRQFQADILERANTSANSFGAVTFRKIDKLLANSGVPVLFYIAPLSPLIEEDIPAARGYERVANAVVAQEKNKGANNMRFVTQIPQPVLDTLHHYDLIHVSDYGDLGQYLAEQIDTLLRAQQ